MSSTPAVVRRCGVLGDPIGHSLSPVLHRAGYAEVGLAWVYDAHRVAAGGLAAFLGGLDATWRGLSLTMPLKREALALATGATERARIAGAANTLLLDGDELHADNTDVPGMVAALRERYDGPVPTATIWGGGATAASAVMALAELGCGAVTLHVRDAARAEQTVAVAARIEGGPVVDVAPLGSPVTSQVLVSTIPAAAQTSDLLAAARGVEAVFDVIYDPWPTPLARDSQERGMRGMVVVGGLDLLVHQAAIQFRAFTGLAAPLAAMREAGERELAARAGPPS
jgi:shikimate dehydrogenase